MEGSIIELAFYRIERSKEMLLDAKIFVKQLNVILATIRDKYLCLRLFFYKSVL
ncbi:MAG TPA: hypothetical protein GXX75_14915 [Clostridiales bacterium]|nr:hypothetical protein [Clostridiales bacterium]